MSDFNIINLNNFTWQLNIAVAGGAFSIFSLIYNEHYIYYGFVTFAFGVSTHVIYKFFEWIFRKEDTNHKNYWMVHLANALFVIIWIIVLLTIY